MFVNYDWLLYNEGAEAPYTAIEGVNSYRIMIPCLDITSEHKVLMNQSVGSYKVCDSVFMA